MTNEMIQKAVEMAERMSLNQSRNSKMIDGAIVILSNGKELVVDYYAAYKTLWSHKGFWVAAMYEDGHPVEA